MAVSGVVVGVLVSVSLAGGAGAGPPTRNAVKACLQTKGLAPEDTGRYILGSSSGTLEAIGVRLPNGEVLVWVTPNAGMASYVQDQMKRELSGRGEVKVIGNVVIAYEAVPTAANRTAIESCASASASGTTPSGPTTSSGPFFLGGHGKVKFVRGKTSGGVSVVASFRGCSGTAPFKLAVTQRRRVGTAIVAESMFTKALGSGTAAPATPAGTPCRDFGSSWPLAKKFFGEGWVVLTLKIVDSGARVSGTPQWAFRAPKP